MADRDLKFYADFENTIGTGPVSWDAPASWGTPKAILIQGASVTGSGSILTDAGMTLAAADDAANAWCFTFIANNGVSTTDSRRRFDTVLSGVAPTLTFVDDNSDTINDEIEIRGFDANSGPGTDKWDGNKTKNGSADYYGMLITGADIDVAVKAAAAGANANDTVDIAHGFGAEPKNLLGLVVSNLDATDATFEAFGSMSVGFFTYRSTDGRIQQYSTNWHFEDGVTGTTEGAQRLSTDRVLAHNINSPYTLEWALEVTAVDATNVTFTTRTGSSGSDKFGVLLLNLPDDVGAWVGVLDSTTDSGSDWEPSTQPGTPTDVLFCVPTGLTVVDTDRANHVEAARAGFGWSIDQQTSGFKDNAVGFTADVNHALGTTVCKTTQRVSHGIYVPDTGGTTKLYAIDHHTQTATGFKYNAAQLDAVPGTARKMIFATVQKPNTYNRISHW